MSGSEGWLSDIHATSAGAIVGLRGAVDVVRVAPDGDAWMVTSVPIPQLTSETTRRLAFSSLWSSSDAVWLTATTFVMRSPDPWDVDAYRVSSISLNGAPIARPMHQIRGTSNTNLWAIGDRHAFHKTTP